MTLRFDTAWVDTERWTKTSSTNFFIKSWRAVDGRVEMWRGSIRFGLSVSVPFVRRCPTSLTITPFPHPAHRTGLADFPRRWFNLLMKLPKPLWNRALQVFFRQQIFLAKKNPWNSDYMRVSSEWWSCINRLSQRLAVFPHTALQLAVSISGQIDDTNLLQGASVIATEQDYSTLLPRYPQLPYWWLAFLWRLSFQNLVGFLALCNDPVTFAAVSSEILPSCPPSLKAVLIPACFHRFRHDLGLCLFSLFPTGFPSVSQYSHLVITFHDLQ